MIIYLVHNIVNHKNYVGQTVQKIYNRRYGHYKAARDGKQYSFPRAIRKYGERNFSWQILHNCNSVREMNEWEEFYIRLLQSDNPLYGYNILSKSGAKLTDEIKKKISDKAKGNQRNKGRTQSEITKNKISITNKGRKISDEQRKQISETLKKYYKNNPDRREKIGKFHKGNKYSLGRKVSMETRVRLSESHKNYKLNETQKREISESLRRTWARKKAA